MLWVENAYLFLNIIYALLCLLKRIDTSQREDCSAALGLKINHQNVCLMCKSICQVIDVTNRHLIAACICKTRFFGYVALPNTIFSSTG